MSPSLLLLLLSLFSALSLASSTLSSDVVYIESGAVQGIVNESGRFFYGIPFAAPPTGAYRWQPPRPVMPWGNSPFIAQSFGPGCPQDCTLPPGTCPLVQSEDCLILNVFTPPTVNPGQLLPVMVFFPGGEYEQGGCMTYLYDGSTLARTTSTIIVITNYRLGALGFVVNDAFPSGNFGFLDQQFALQWVQRNIAAFGGDRNSVTIFGQSAGGTSTTSHLISPQSKGLFHRAIVESNPVGLDLNTLEMQRQYSADFAKFAGCDGVGAHLTQCMLNLTVPEILAAQKKTEEQVNISEPIYIFYPWTPTIDGNVIPGQPVTLFEKGLFNPVDFILGNVHDEAWMFIWEVQPLPVPSVEYYAILAALFGENAPAVEKLYPVSPLAKDTRPQLNNVITDYLFICPGRYLVQSALRTHPEINIYNYEFNHVGVDYNAWGPDYSFCWFDYVCHASELPFVFDSATVGGYTFTPDEQVLSEEMVRYWGNFAHTNDPNKGPGGSPSLVWPLYQLDSMTTLNLNLTLGYISALRQPYCDYWDSVGYFQP